MPVEIEQQIKLQISQIIERTRVEEEAFLHDSKKAAENIISYLKEKHLI